MDRDDLPLLGLRTAASRLLRSKSRTIQIEYHPALPIREIEIAVSGRYYIPLLFLRAIRWRLDNRISRGVGAVGIVEHIDGAARPRIQARDLKESIAIARDPPFLARPRIPIIRHRIQFGARLIGILVNGKY